MLHRRRHDADVLEMVKSPAEAHDVSRPEAAEHLNLFGLAGAARLPLHAERFVLDVIPAQTDAQPKPPTAQQISLGRLLGNDACLPLRRDQNAGRKPNGLGDGGQKAKRDKRLVESILLIVKRHPAIPAFRSEDVIGDFDIRVSEIFGCLRPIADLGGIGPNIKRREKGIVLHGSPPNSSPSFVTPSVCRRVNNAEKRVTGGNVSLLRMAICPSPSRVLTIVPAVSWRSTCTNPEPADSRTAPTTTTTTNVSCARPAPTMLSTTAASTPGNTCMGAQISADKTLAA